MNAKMKHRKNIALHHVRMVNVRQHNNDYRQRLQSKPTGSK